MPLYACCSIVAAVLHSCFSGDVPGFTTTRRRLQLLIRSRWQSRDCDHAAVFCRCFSGGVPGPVLVSSCVSLHHSSGKQRGSRGVKVEGLFEDQLGGEQTSSDLEARGPRSCSRHRKLRRSGSQLLCPLHSFWQCLASVVVLQRRRNKKSGLARREVFKVAPVPAHALTPRFGYVLAPT